MTEAKGKVKAKVEEVKATASDAQEAKAAEAAAEEPVRVYDDEGVATSETIAALEEAGVNQYSEEAKAAAEEAEAAKKEAE